MGVTLSGEQISKMLANANEVAKFEGEDLRGRFDLMTIEAGVEMLSVEDVPKTYMAITAVLLAARALREPDELDVLVMKSGAGDLGYSASSVGSRLAAFAKEQGIDLRARSSQPMNNQPFCFEPILLESADKMNVKSTAWGHYGKFYALAVHINSMSSDQAKRGLALLIHMRQRADVAQVSVSVKGSGLKVLNDISAAVSEYVDAFSDNGKVGQSFVAAMLDLIYPFEDVILGDSQDPDVPTPGDVQAAKDGQVWLWAEVKQKVISTGDITGFFKIVKEMAGGARVDYFALKNASYSGNISPEALKKDGNRLGVEYRVFNSPREALSAYLPFAVGSHAQISSKLLERLRARLMESHCSVVTIEAFDAMATQHAELS